MGIGKRTRLNRIFSHPSGRLCSVAVDHFLGYQHGLPPGLTNLPQTLKEVMAGRPDAVTMLKGTAMGCWQPYAGLSPLILQAVAYNPDESVIEVMTEAEEAIRLGADAMAVAIGVRGPNEGKFLKLTCRSSPTSIPVTSATPPRSCMIRKISPGQYAAGSSVEQTSSKCPIPAMLNRMRSLFAVVLCRWSRLGDQRMKRWKEPSR